ncbi:hypothetical protein EH240_33455 [Mesorhizobium tamadayense]|uniref:site-specific DNA-methyltransferase (adenine-specific) n=1 Tax=Mesorhizobium tamadayense TaxID=425306 RepID=A0A3P3EUN6_9HYPH|nr:N-6 DNA methylase [Mesorhizobium tamadayense]RRH90109.1 hypothetical protein EH240_33455 [Mesorhizobium tamadayense]
MIDPRLTAAWSQRFGLARSPMFGAEADAGDGYHEVLLDGGYGSFGLSVVEERPNPADVAGWAWSSDLPHHVAVTEKDVQVVRWDAAGEAQLYSLTSVNRDLDAFYRYLCRDRLRSNRTVVQHLVSLFGRIRSLVAHAGLPDARSIDAFVTVLGDLIAENAVAREPEADGLPTDAASLRDALAGPTLEEALSDIRNAPSTLSALALHPHLAVRHAGGQLFQEAHFDLVRAPPPDLFGFVDAATSVPTSRGGTHFTPPALARCIVDHTLLQVAHLSSRQHLVLSDPACGSAAFLHEALRGLRRAGFNGALRIVGRDISGSAIAMARFTLTLALRDWTPAGGAELDLLVEDALSHRGFPEADVTVMNPPFISVIAQTAEQKAQLRAVVGDRAGSRGDYSMAFVSRALEALRSGGALGTLFPANLLTHEAATSWREHLGSDGDVRLLASIGDFGLFSQALVHVACAVIAKGQPRQPEFTALVTENDPGATGDALRELRKTAGTPPAIAVGDEHWKLFASDSAVLAKKMPWRILTPNQRRVLDAIEARQTPTVGDLFDIAQGVQTGNLKVFLFDDEAFRRLRLPASEQQYFRDAIMTDSIEDGRVLKYYHLFYPHGPNGPLFANEVELAAAVPTYYRQVLKSNEQSLRNRASIVRAKRSDWWGLMHPRAGAFAFDKRPRIISKFFGSDGSFALDEDARYLPSTGHVWSPKLQSHRVQPSQNDNPASDAVDEPEESDIDASVSLDVMRAYTALLNSRAFMKLVSFRSVTIAGGQLDLSSRFVSPVFLPNLWEQGEDPLSGAVVRQLARATITNERGQSPNPTDIDRLVGRLYGVAELGEV